MSQPTRILILDAHPDPESFCRALGLAYENGARSSGAQVERLVLAELSFDPILHHGYREAMPLEPDLQKAQELLRWCEHLVLVHPLWWGTYPALLKGFFDRVLLPGFAFKYRKDSVFWDKLLAGRSAHILYTMDQPLFYYWLVNGAPGLRSLKRMVLGFSGFKPVRSTAFAPVRYSSQKLREAWLEKAQKLGEKRS